MAKVVVYTAQWCSWCHKLIDFLNENKVEYEAKDVDNPDNARAAMEVSGQGGIPITVVDGTVVIGFDVEKLKQLLNLA